LIASVLAVVSAMTVDVHVAEHSWILAVLLLLLLLLLIMMMVVVVVVRALLNCSLDGY
jgi:hypothetical protein